MPKIIIVQPGDSVEMDPVGPGMAHGYGLFETLKLEAGRLCFWKAHWDRLEHSAEKLGIGLEHSMSDVLEAVWSLARSAKLEDAVIKLSLLKDRKGSKLYVYSRPKISVPVRARCLVSKSSPINEHSILAGHKTHNYMENMLLLEAAKTAGYDDMIRINSAGNLAETTIGNLFFLAGDTLFTPSLNSGILNGTVRSAIIEIASSVSLKVEEAEYEPSVLTKANGIFVTNASCGVLPVHQVDGMGVEFMANTTSFFAIEKLRVALREFEQLHSVGIEDG
ncbi:MAG: aminotransferase class IV [Verrucomicrobiota bacterium]